MLYDDRWGDIMISGYIVRIEEDLAVILTEDEEYQINYPAALLPDNVGEGDYITIDIFYDEEKTKAAMAEAMELMK